MQNINYANTLVALGFDQYTGEPQATVIAAAAPPAGTEGSLILHQRQILLDKV
jgi:hypothetical protein